MTESPRPTGILTTWKERVRERREQDQNQPRPVSQVSKEEDNVSKWKKVADVAIPEKKKTALNLDDTFVATIQPYTSSFADEMSLDAISFDSNEHTTEEARVLLNLRPTIIREQRGAFINMVRNVQKNGLQTVGDLRKMPIETKIPGVSAPGLVFLKSVFERPVEPDQTN